MSALEQESEKDVERQRRAHDELREVKAPPLRRGRKEPTVMQHVASLAGARTWIFPPAYEGWGNAEDCGFNLPLGEINTERHMTGDGWGWAARAYGTQYCTLWFYYFPPTAGSLLVQPHVDFQGDVAVGAHDHWYTSTHAELELKLRFDLFQHYVVAHSSHAHVDCNFRTGADRRIRVEHIWVDVT